MTFKDNVLQFQNLAFSIYMSQYIVYTKFYCHLNIYISTKNRLDAQFTIRYTLYKEMRYIENVRLPYPCWINSIKTCLNKFTINFLILNEKKSSSIRPYFPVGDITEKHYFYSSLIYISTQFNLFKFTLIIWWFYSQQPHPHPPPPKNTLVREKRWTRPPPSQFYYFHNEY